MKIKGFLANNIIIYFLTVTEKPESARIKLCSEQDQIAFNEVRDTCSQTISNLNVDRDDKITKQKLLSKTKVDQSYNRLSDSQTQPDSGQTELNSIIVENTKREIAHEVSRSQEDKRNILCSRKY
jgi:predicted NUDIX family phosphoesterase